LDDDASPAALQSFIHSNRTLKELILPWLIAPKAAEMDMGDNPLKIVEAYTVSGRLLSKERTLFFNGTDVKDGEEEQMITELTKPDSTWRTLHIERFGSGMLHCITKVLSRPNSLTKIIIDQDTFDEDDDQIALYRALSHNSSVKKVHLNFQINPQTLDLLASIGTNASINMHLILKCTNRNEILSASKITAEEALDLARALSTVTKIRELELTLPYIDDSAFQALVKGLPTSLTSLDVEDNSISIKSLPVILDFLKTHTTLKKLSLTNNGITVKEEQARNLLQTIHQVADANNCVCNIPINERVEEALAKDEEKINLFNAYLRDDHVRILCTELMKNPNRSRSVDLRGNGRITEVGYQYLADVLPKVSISVLLAGINNMTEPQQIILFNGLAKNKTIKELDLDENKIGQQAVPILMQIIQNNPALESIDVSQCSLDNDAAVNIASFWKNTHLKKMKATFNGVLDRGFASLLQSRPPTLVALDLSFNPIGEESLPILLQFLASLPIQTPVDGLDWDAATELAKKNGVFELCV
jgi:Ran GTPase-activating protein (RanGAP) involved in mRNA processing and transport